MMQRLRGQGSAPLLGSLFLSTWRTTTLLAVLQTGWYLGLPLTLFSLGTSVRAVLPAGAALVLDIARLGLQQRLRRSLRTKCMVSAARDALSNPSPVPETSVDSAFWASHLAEYAVSTDVPAVLASAAAILGIVVLASLRLGVLTVLPIVGAVGLVAAVGFLAHRRLGPLLGKIVSTRRRAAAWMAAAERDAGEISGSAAEPFLLEVGSAVTAWCRAEDALERRRIVQRSVLWTVLAVAVLTLACTLNFAWLTNLLQARSSVSIRGVSDAVLFATSLPAALVLARHANALLTARAELIELRPPQPAAIRSKGRALSSIPLRLVAKRLQVRYGTHLALDLVDLDLPLAGGVVIVGPNGAGKSTLVATLVGALQPSTGTLEIDGILASRVDPDSVAYVPQDPVVVQALSVVENARLVVPNATDDAVVQALRRFGLDSRAHALAGDLSRGERKRIALARAILKDPALLVLDEPDAWLDASGLETLATVLQEELSRRAIVVTTHRQDFAGTFATRLGLSAAHTASALGTTREVACED